jgi:hypothetical protein
MSDIYTKALLNNTQFMSKIQVLASQLTTEISKIEAASMKMMQSSMIAANAMKNGYDIVTESIKRTQMEMEKLSKPIRLSIDCGNLRSSVQHCLESASFKIKCECTGSSGSSSISETNNKSLSIDTALGITGTFLGLTPILAEALGIGTAPLTSGITLGLGTGYGLNRMDEFAGGWNTPTGAFWKSYKAVAGLTPFGAMFSPLQSGAGVLEDVFAGKNPLPRFIQGLQDQHGWGISGYVSDALRNIKLPTLSLPKINTYAITGPIQSAITTVTGYWNRFKGLVSQGVHGTISIASGTLGNAYGLAQRAYGYIREGAKGVVTIISSGIDYVKNAVTSL